MTNLIGNGRQLQVCDLCGGVDDHPRHVIAGGVAGTYPPPSPAIIAAVVAAAPEDERDRLVADLVDQSSLTRHMDCCAEAGCPTGTCDDVIATAGSRRGGALLGHIQKGG